jgi:hypothetical protein
MNEHGSFRPVKEDWTEIVHHLRKHGNILFAYSPNRADAFIILMVRRVNKVGTLPWGGNPTGYLVTSVMKWGMIYTMPGVPLHKGYVKESLPIDWEEGLESITELLNEVGDRLHGKKTS